MTEPPPRLDQQTRHWLKLEVSRRRKERELHVGRPVLHRYSKQVASGTLDLAPRSRRDESAANTDRAPAKPTTVASAPGE